jgi:hypothetical protein
MHIPGPDKFKLSPDDSSTSGSLKIDVSNANSVDLKVDYQWTLDKKY